MGSPTPTQPQAELIGLDEPVTTDPVAADKAPDAEQAILAAVISNPELFYDVSDIVASPDFSVIEHQLIWDAVVSCERQGTAIDEITVASELQRSETLASAGGKDRLRRVIENGAVSQDAAVDIAGIVFDRAEKRRTSSLGRRISTYAARADTSGAESREFAEEAVHSLESRASDGLRSVGQLAPAMMRAVLEARTDILIGLDTGFDGLNRLTQGAQGGQLVVLAARPAMGKSAIALQMAASMAATSRKHVLFYSYEMSSNELLMRMVSTESGIGLQDFRSGLVGSDAQMAGDIQVAAKKIDDLPLLIDDSPPPTISGLRASARRASRKYDVGAIFVDYLQLLGADNNRDMNMVNQVAEISRGLKMLAKSLDVPVIALSQLSRGLESRPNKVPMLSDLRDSGAIEQDADTVWFLYRDVVYNAAADAEAAKLVIAKQRMGPTGNVPLRFVGQCARFYDAPPQGAPVGPPGFHGNNNTGQNAPAPGAVRHGDQIFNDEF